MDRQQLENRCQEHWLRLGLTSEDALMDYIRGVFEKFDHQADVIIEIYKLVLPDWDQIEMVNEPPEAGSRLWKFICGEFIQFDKMHHPNVFKGGIWMNNGFSSNSNLDPWELSFKNCKVTMA